MSRKDNEPLEPDEPLRVELDPRIDQLVGEKLRNYYDDLLEVSVPSRIVDLIKALAEKESKEAREPRK